MNKCKGHVKLSMCNMSILHGNWFYNEMHICSMQDGKIKEIIVIPLLVFLHPVYIDIIICITPHGKGILDFDCYLIS